MQQPQVPGQLLELERKREPLLRVQALVLVLVQSLVPQPVQV